MLIGNKVEEGVVSVVGAVQAEQPCYLTNKQIKPPLYRDESISAIPGLTNEGSDHCSNPMKCLVAFLR
jgi:hypothetical protein